MVNMISNWYKRHFSNPDTVALLAIIICSFLFIYFFCNILMPVFVAISIAFLLDWPATKLTQCGISRTMSVSIVVFAFISISLITFLGLMPVIWQQGTNLVKEAPLMFSEGQAYLLIPNKDITQNAKKRLSAIRKLTKLGSGFNIALEDLEIRGAGNLFGTEQSGNIYDVGIEFYLDLLEKEIGKLKNNQQIESLETEIISQISFFIPRKYIESSETRLFYYKKISLINKKEDSIKIIEELLDKFGTVPQEILNLICISEIKIECERLRVSKIILKKEALIINIKKIGKITNAQIEIINFDAKPSETLEFLSKISKMEDILKSNYEIINDKFIINSRLLL